MTSRRLKVAFIHPDLGIGGAERLVVDAASWAAKRRAFICCWTLLRRNTMSFFVDQLSTCIPIFRALAGRRVVFYCHFPDKLLANGAYVEGDAIAKKTSMLKRLYRLPMNWLEEVTTRQADIILANSGFTARVFKFYFPSIPHSPSIKNIVLALESFAKLKVQQPSLKDLRLVLAGGYDDRLEDNRRVIFQLQSLAKALSLTYNIISPAPLPPALSSPGLSGTPNPDVTFLLNFTTQQRTALLRSPSTLALLYTPENEHFGIVPIEAMACGVPVLACNSGGPLESIAWATVLLEIVSLSKEQRTELSVAAKDRARSLFGMEAMANGIEQALQQAVEMGPVELDDALGPWWKLGICL
ncbi:alpha-1,3-mannosyltransferase ALG2, partial [Coprinopsis sp. MPI-PUGE-AT-0042]